MPDNNSLRYFLTPNAPLSGPTVARLAVEANNIEPMRVLIQMVQQSQFSGLPTEDPTAHLTGFVNICGTFKIDKANDDDIIKFQLFPLSLKDKARAWFHSVPPKSVEKWKWKDLSQAFLEKYFPPGKTIKLRSDITNFCQIEGESLYEAWERYKDLQRQCPHHGLPDWLLMHTFYNGLSHSLRITIDAAAGGALMAKTAEEAYEVLERMAWNNYQWSSERLTQRRSASVFEVDSLSMINEKFDALNKKLDKISLKAVETSSSLGHLYGGVHLRTDHPLEPYNPSWKRNLNFSWSNLLNQSYQSNSRPPLGFQQRMPIPSLPYPPQSEEQKFNLELLMDNVFIAQKQQDEAINQLTSKVDQLTTHNKILESQIIQQASSSSRGQYKLYLD